MSPRPNVQPRSVTLHQLGGQIKGAQVLGDARITGITIDSRDVQPGDLFAALRGSDFDGHAYIRHAIANGAAAVLAEALPDDVVHPAIMVTDSRRDLAPVATEFYGNPSHDLQVIGLTGTDGKTTTTALVQWILREAGVQTGTIGTLGIQPGDGTDIPMGHQTTPESHLIQGYLRQMVEVETRVAVLEATSHGLAMHRLDGTRFTIAGVTNITQEHLEYHKTVAAYRAAKGILIQRVVAANGKVILNADDPGAMNLIDLALVGQVRTYAVKHPDVDLRATDVVVDDSGCRFVLHAEDKQMHVTLPLLGEFNVANALCAIGVTHAAGIPVETAVAALVRAPGVPGRMQRIDAGQSFGVVVDYAHTPASLEKALTMLRNLMSGGRLIVVSGSAGERDVVKRPLQGKVMGDLADIVVITSEDPRNEDPAEIIRAIAAGTESTAATVYQIVDRRDAIAFAFSQAAASDMVLLAGKGHETSMIWGFEHRPWDESALARELLSPYAQF